MCDHMPLAGLVMIISCRVIKSVEGLGSMSINESYLEGGMLQLFLEVGAGSILGEQPADAIVLGQESLQLGTVVEVVILFWVPDLDHIGLVECRVQGASTVQNSQSLAQNALSRGNASIGCADDAGRQVQTPVVVLGNGDNELIPACACQSWAVPEGVSNYALCHTHTQQNW